MYNTHPTLREMIMVKIVLKIGSIVCELITGTAL